MVFGCDCGKRFRTPADSFRTRPTCPGCGRSLRPEKEIPDSPQDPAILFEQIKLLRDELVARDRALRDAHDEIERLTREVEARRMELKRSSFSSIPYVAAGVPIENAAARPLRLPSDRVPTAPSAA